MSNQLPPDLRKEYRAPFAIFSAEEGKRYSDLISRNYNPVRSLNFALIEKPDVRKAVEAHCRTLHFDKIIEMNHHAYEELMLQFYTTLNFNDGGFSFRVNGKTATVKRKTLRRIFGFPEGGRRTVPRDFDHAGFWREISGGGGGKKLGRLIRDPDLFIMHRCISQIFFGRDDSSKVTLADLFYLSCLRRREGARAAAPSFLIASFRRVVTRNRANMCLGNFITAIALHFRMFDPTGLKVLPTRLLGLSTIKSACKDAKEEDDDDDDSFSSSSSSSSASSDEAADDSPPVAIATALPYVDSWKLISREMEHMQTRMNDGFNNLKAGFDGLEKKFDSICARFQTFQREWADLRRMESNKTMGKLRQEKSESDKAAEISKTMIDRLSTRVKKMEESLGKISSLNVVDLANVVNDMREIGTFEEGEKLESPDSMGTNESLRDKSMPDVDIAHDVDDVDIDLDDGFVAVLSKNEDINSPKPQTAHNLPQPAIDECIEPIKCSVSAAARDIIEISDSDDETPPNVGSETSKRVPNSDEINDLNQRNKRKRTESMDNLAPFSTTKMKKEVCVDVHESLNHLKEEVSAHSEDEPLSDSRMEDLVASLRRGINGARKFMYEADMLRAFQHDEELCLNAVCALYRQTVSAKKSSGRSTLSKENGFSPIDSMSGRTTAEYLINGDKELRLTRPISLVRRQRPDVIARCKKLAITYVKKLFEIYCLGDDPLFCQ